MGTRNLTMVIDDQNNFKVAQYGQWDGYPSGQGVCVLTFARNKEKLEKLKAELLNIRFIEDNNEIDSYIKQYNSRAASWSNEKDNRTPEDRYWWDNLQTRDLCANILDSIIFLNKSKLPEEMKGFIYLSNGQDFGKDSLFCEWAYCINFNTNTLDCYCGFNKNKSKQSKLFYVDEEEAKENSGYYGIRLVKKYDLNDLPSDEQFIEELEREEE